MDINADDINGFVGTILEIIQSVFKLDMDDPEVEDDMDYIHHEFWLALEDFFGINPNDMKAKYRIEKV